MKDYSKYFKGPSLKDARSRGRTEVQHLDDAFEIPADMVGIGKGQTYYIQTYGCQANERDTETLSGSSGRGCDQKNPVRSEQSKRTCSYSGRALKGVG